MSIVHIAFYPSDWLAGTRGLSAEETGVYITLIARMYEMAGPIERDDQRLARLCGCKSRAAFVKCLEYLISEGKIVEVENGLFNNRVEKEVQNSIEKSSKARAAAEARWDKKPNKINGGDLRTHPPSICQPEPEPYIGDGEDAREAEKPPPDDADPPEFRERLLSAMGADPTNGITGPNGTVLGTMADMQLARRWLDDLQLTEAEVVSVAREVMRRKRDGPPRSFGYFTEAMRRYAGQRNQPALSPQEIDHEPDRKAGPTATNRRDNGTDAALEQIARLAVLRPSSGDDWP